MKTLSLLALGILPACLSWSAADPATGRIIPHPYVSQPDKPARPIKPVKPVKPVLPPPSTNIIRRMQRPVRVVSQSVLNNQLVSRMSDGTTAVAPLRRATTVRIPHAIAALRAQRAIQRINAASGPDAPARAAALEALADQLESAPRKPPKDKPSSNPGLIIAAAVAGAAGGAAAASIKRKGNAS